jgi:long-chain acyl-CoA synthetase
VKEELDKLSSEFKGYERIRNFALISEDFTQENGMLTPKLSLKRRNVMQKWGGELEKLYK